MRAEKAIYALLAGTAGITGLVSTRIYPAPLPQGTALPAIAITHVSTSDYSTIDANQPYGLVQSRIECTALAANYADVKTIIEAIRVALNFQRGTFGGVDVASIVRAGVGPDLRDDDMQVYYQSIDFLVTLRE